MSVQSNYDSVIQRVNEIEEENEADENELPEIEEVAEEERGTMTFSRRESSGK